MTGSTPKGYEGDPSGNIRRLSGEQEISAKVVPGVRPEEAATNAAVQAERKGTLVFAIRIAFLRYKTTYRINAALRQLPGLIRTTVRSGCNLL
jgi:hypothetical protein